MHYPIKFDTNVEVKTLTDLPRLKIILEAANLKPNMSKIARDIVSLKRLNKLEVTSHEKGIKGMYDLALGRRFTYGLPALST